MPNTVAAFDWDGTLTVRDCVVPFLTRVAGASTFLRQLVSRPSPLLKGLVGRDRDRLKQVGVAAALSERQVEEVHETGRRFADHVLAQWMRPDTLARLRWHQAVGHRVVIVSASLGPYLHPLGHRLGVDAVLCTELLTAEGRFTGDLAGPNCRGPHKLERLATWTALQPEPLALGWAYGDSRGDEALLAAAATPVWVGRQRLDAVPATQGRTA